MRVRARACGLEYEFGAVLRNDSGGFRQAPELLLTRNFLLRRHAFSGTIMPHEHYNRAWHINGSCTYVDRGDHPEHCTPECLSAMDAVRFAKAGEQLCVDYFEDVPVNGYRIALFKNNLGCDVYGEKDGTFGCHENYMLRDGRIFYLDETENLRMFFPFLITRQIFDGAGWWSREGIYTFSQRSVHIRDRCPSPYGFASTKCESSTGDRSVRLHVICGDSNILEFATYLKVGTMMLITALAEANKLPDLECWALKTCLEEMTSGTDVKAETETLKLQGTPMSPLQVQTLYLEAVREALKDAEFDSEEIEAESRHVLLLWEQTLNALYRNDEKWMRGRIDWVTKKYIIETMINAMRNPAPDSIRRMRKDIDIGYHNISDPWLQERMRKTWPDRRICTDSDIERAKTIPPQNTRALLRSRFIEASLRRNTYVVVDWAKFIVVGGGVYAFPNPLICQDPALEEYFTR